jgi:hypothetical protein
MNEKLIDILAGVLFISGSMIIAPNVAGADEGKFEVKPGATIREILADRTGKRVTLRMQSGEDIEGTVVLVGNGLVHVSKLAGKDFYDAVVAIDRISAVIMKVRDR